MGSRPANNGRFSQLKHLHRKGWYCLGVICQQWEGITVVIEAVGGYSCVHRIGIQPAEAETANITRPGNPSTPPFFWLQYH
jgi:hypothetical protein